MNLNERVFKVIDSCLVKDVGNKMEKWFYQWYTICLPGEKGVRYTILVVRKEIIILKE